MKYHRLLPTLYITLTIIIFSISNAESAPPRLPEYITTHFTASGGDKKTRIMWNPQTRKYENRANDIREDGTLNPYFGKDPDLIWMNYYKDGHPFNENIKPAFNSYHNDTTAHTAVRVEFVNQVPANDSDSDGIPNEIENYEQLVYAGTGGNNGGYHTDILNYKPWVSPLQDTDLNNRLLVDHPNIQILNNYIYGNSLFTICFPPNWNPNRKYPVKLHGMGGDLNNNDIYLTQYTSDAIHAGLSAKYGSGMIFVQSNAGGKESSGLAPDPINDAGNFLVNVMANYGADINRVAMAGASRAGRMALIWGANPNHFPYNIVAIHSFVPPIKNINGTTISSFPAWSGAIIKDLGSPRAYRLGEFVNEEVSPPQVMTVADLSQAMLKAQLGSNTPEEALAKMPYGIFSRDELTSSLQTKRILVSYGAHDAFMPTPALFDFDYLLKSKNIPARIVFGYACGHGFYDPLNDDVDTLLKMVQGQTIEPFSGNTRVFYLPNKLINAGQGTNAHANGFVEINQNLITRVRQTRGYENYFRPDHDVTKLGFSVTIPYKETRNLPISVVLMGEKGKRWEIFLRKEDGYYAVYKRWGIFGEPGVFGPDGRDVSATELSVFNDEYAVLTLSDNLQTGTYEWFFKYNGQEIPNRFTPLVPPGSTAERMLQSAKAISIITENQPFMTEYFHPYGQLPGQNVNNGVDQYHPFLLQGNQAPVFTPIQQINLRVGQRVTVTFQATDPDGDELVYDVINADNGQLLRSVSFNGKTGVLNYTARVEDIGTYRLKAIAKDGLGGVGEYTFNAVITP